MTEELDGTLYREDAGIKYKLMTLPDFRKFRELALGESSEWSVHYTDELTQVVSRPPGDNSTSLNIIRVRRIMPGVPPKLLYDQFQDSTYRATWDDKMIEGYNIVQLDSHNDVGYYSAKFPWPLANRDYCNQRSWMEFSNGDYVIFNHSEPHNRCPVKKNFVRAKSIRTGYFIQPFNGGVGSVLTYVTHSDPCGAIPHTLINYTMTKLAPAYLTKIEEYTKAYPNFCMQKYAPGYVHPWVTPKMDWDSKYRYPEEEMEARAKATEQWRSVAAEDGKGEASPQVTAGKNVTLAVNAGQPGPHTVEGEITAAPLLSLAPVAPITVEDGLAIQQYRATLQDAMNAVDRSFLREGRAPTTREYIVRLKYTIDGIRRTTTMP